MWSVPFNLGVHSSYLAVGMVYNEGRFVFLVNIIIIVTIITSHHHHQPSCLHALTHHTGS